MIALAELIEHFEPDLLRRFEHSLLPSQHQALAAMKRCRTRFAPRMLAQCTGCSEQRSVPHSCGHRACPHCQHHEGQVWLQRQLALLVPATYFLVTFTLPAELRGLAWTHQRTVYPLLMQCAWETLSTFSRNDPKLGATPGAVGVLHTISRRLDFHPHIHMVMPAAALDTQRRLWRTKPGRRHRASKKTAGAASAASAANAANSANSTNTTNTTNTTNAAHPNTSAANRNAGGTPAGAYLFSHKALAKVFRAKLLDAIELAGLVLPPKLPSLWVVDFKCVGDGSKALLYLGRYLYRGVIQEADILTCKDGLVTFRYRDAKTGKSALRTLPGADFLWLVLQHVLPKGLRRSRNFGFLHPNSAQAIRLLQVLHLRAAPSAGLPAIPPRATWRCTCGQPMRVIRRRMPPQEPAADGRATQSHSAPGPAPGPIHNNSPGADRTAPLN